MKGECLACELFDKTSFENTLREIGGDKVHSVAIIAADRHKMLDDLLCTIHRDGGHRIKEVGYKQATVEAVKIAANLVQAGS